MSGGEESFSQGELCWSVEPIGRLSPRALVSRGPFKALTGVSAGDADEDERNTWLNGEPKGSSGYEDILLKKPSSNIPKVLLKLTYKNEKFKKNVPRNDVVIMENFLQRRAR